jgi:hypothetical protein
MTLGWTALVRRDAPPDPFVPYDYIFRSEYEDLSARQEFSCNTNSIVTGFVAGGRYTASYVECTYDPAAGPVSRITAGYFPHFNVAGGTYVNAHFTRITFAARERALTIGDLALLWGSPNIHYTNSLVTFTWPGFGVTAVSLRPSETRWDYFLPIVAINFYNGS